MSERKRIIYLDVARMIAIISVSFNHAVNRSFAVNAGQYTEYQNIPFLLTIIKSVLYAFSRIGVPLFAMITGALLLSRKYDRAGTSKFIKHNWLQLFITTEIWLTIMFWYMQMASDSLLFTRGIVYTFIRFIMTLLFLNPITLGSMWYMEMILCLYLMIPILSFAVEKLEVKYFLILGVIVLFCSYILPDINGALAALGMDFVLETKLESANIFSMYVIYLLLGHFINKGALARIQSRILWIIMIVGFASFCIFQIWFYSVDYDFVVGKGYHSIFPMIIAVTVFELLRRNKCKEDSRIAKISMNISAISFGIYFIHICIMEGLNKIVSQTNVTLLWRFILLESISFFGAIVLIQLLKRNRLLRKYLIRI